MSSMPLPVPDLVLLAFVAVFLLRGVFRGTLRELSNLLAWGLGLFASMRFDVLALAGLDLWLGKESPWLAPSARAVTFVVVWIGVNAAGRVLCFIAASGSLGPADRLGGAVLGGVKAVLLAAAIAVLAEAYAPDRFAPKDVGTRLLPYVQALGDYLKRASPDTGVELPKEVPSPALPEPQPPRG